MGATMTKTVDDAIAELQREIAAAEADLNAKKNTVNVLCGVVGRPPAYRVEEPEAAPELGLSFPPDAFYGEPLATSARRVLETSKASGGSALSLDALYATLKAGGFAFDAKSDATARRSLAISLAKNTAMFLRLPNGDIGLRGWYKRIVRQREPGAANDRDEIVDNDDNGEFEEPTSGNGSAAGLLPAPAVEDANQDMEDRDR